MKRLFALCGALMAAACQTPGYDYTARAAPAYAEALAYTDVAVGRFRGPAGDVAEAAFQALIDGAELQGARWFAALDPARPQGIYEGDVAITGFRRETSLKRERRCDKHKGLFNCERHVVIEMHCPKEIVEVSVAATLTDFATGRRIFTSQHSGVTEREDCFDVAEYPDTDQSTGSFGEIVHEGLSPWDAPVGMVADAVAAAIPAFRYDIAPYMTTLRAEIVHKPLVLEERADLRLVAAVKATRRGEIIGACTEARGDLEGAHLLYAEAAEIARTIPLLRDRDAQAIFASLSRISRGRHENTLIDQATGAPAY